MQKLWQKHQKFMKGNAGFSLVELIIVIAIMAALVAILAPQYLKYVEKSRVTGDENTATELANAIKVAAVDETYTAALMTQVGTTGLTIGLSKTAAPTGISGTLQTALTEYFGSNYADVRLKSTKYAAGIDIKLSITTNASGDSTLNVAWAVHA